MKVYVLSDTHSRTTGIAKIASKKADAYIHCGDSELRSDNPFMLRMHAVRGNCDHDPTFPDIERVEIGSKRLIAVHGHQHQVNHSLLGLTYLAAEEEADIVLFGHTHKMGVERIDGVLYINPGSLHYPRGEEEGSYICLEWEEDGPVHIQFLTIEDELLAERTL